MIRQKNFPCLPLEFSHQTQQRDQTHPSESRHKVRGESERQPGPRPLSPHPTRNPKGHRQTVLICMTEDESGHHQLQDRSWGRMLSGRSPVASGGICCPRCHNPPPFQPATGAAAWPSASKWRVCGSPGGLGQGPASGELIPL